ADDLAARRRVHRLWAEPSFGLMGRTPDHVACLLSAFAGWRQLFDRGGTRFGDNVVRFYERARDEELYVAYGIVPLQIDRSQPAHRQPEPFLYPGVVAERDGGIVIRGSQGITTSAVLADWLFISYITPLQAGDEAYALSFVTPVAASGIRIPPRRPYAQTATSVFDYPLSSRFDEVDATVVFDDVFVPWEQVFVYRDVGLVNAQFHESPSHTLANFHACVRFNVRLEFMAGRALKLLEVHAAEKKPEAQVTLGGELAALCATFDAIVQGGLKAECQHLGVGCGGVGAAESLDADLQKFGGLVAAASEDRTEIAKSARLAGRGRRQVIARHRDGEVGPQAEFAAFRV